MANFFQRLINAALGTHLGEAPTVPPSTPPAQPIAPEAQRLPPRRVEFPISGAPQQPPIQRPGVREFPIGGQGPIRLQPVFTPQPRTHTLTLTGSVANDGHGTGYGKAYREAKISFTDSQWKRYIYYQSIGKVQTARVYALAEVYGVAPLAGASWDPEFDYDEFDYEEWPDYDEWGYYALE